jgi:hypothetical protein
MSNGKGPQDKKEEEEVKSPHEELMAACSQAFTHMVELLLEERILLTPYSYWSRLLAKSAGGCAKCREKKQNRLCWKIPPP